MEGNLILNLPKSLDITAPQMDLNRKFPMTGEAILRWKFLFKIFCIFISICGWFVAMGSAAAVPKSGMPPETSPLPAAMSPLATLEALQKQKTLSSDQNHGWFGL